MKKEYRFFGEARLNACRFYWNCFGYRCRKPLNYEKQSSYLYSDFQKKKDSKSREVCRCRGKCWSAMQRKKDSHWQVFIVMMGKVAWDFERPAFQALMRDIEAGKIDILLTKDLSRLGRNSARTTDLLDEYFPSKGVRYISVNEGVDTQAESSANLIAPIANAVNELYARIFHRKSDPVCTPGWKPASISGVLRRMDIGKAIKNMASWSGIGRQRLWYEKFLLGSLQEKHLLRLLKRWNRSNTVPHWNIAGQG